MRVRLLGPVAVEVGGEPATLPGSRQRAVLALLAVRSDIWTHRDVIIDELWGEDPPKTARNSVQRFVSDIRTALGAERDRLDSADSAYRLTLDRDELDATEAERLIAAGDASRAAGELDAAAASYSDALELWRGASIADVVDVPAVDVERIRLEELRLATTEAYLTVELDLGRHQERLPHLAAATADHPFREGLWALHITALYRSGRQAEALQAYQALRTNLVDELGLEPSERLRELEAQILAQASDLSPGLPQPASPLDRYELGEVVMRRPHVEVRRAVLEPLGRPVAITTIEPTVADDPDFIRRFEADLRLVSGVEHPNVVPVLDGWRDRSGAHIVTAPHPGRHAGEPDAIERELIVDGVANALRQLHENGFVHGSVEPSMVWLGDDGVALYSAALERSTVDPQVDVDALITLARTVGLRSAADAATIPSSIDEAVALLADDGSARPATNPYKGLRAFQEADAEDLHGRRGLVERLLTAVAANRFVTVVGPSGSGKSSAVRAGLVPALRAGTIPGSERWFIAAFIPGASPFQELAAALRQLAVDPPADLVSLLAADDDGIRRTVESVLPDDGDVVILVDQFEELFTQVPAKVRIRFLDGLINAVVHVRSRVRVVATIRADFLDRPLATPGLGELVREGAVLVEPMSADGIEQAITSPADRVGVRFAPGVAAQVGGDVLGEPAALPLLQHALRELFDARSGAEIQLADYEAVGGVHGALANRADAVYGGFEASQQELTRQIFLRLITINETGEVTRRRVLRSELTWRSAEPDDVEHVLEELGRHRFLTFDRDPLTREPSVEVAHEALLSAWSRARRWIDDGQAGVLMHRRVAAATGEWRANNRDDSFLASGTQLDQFASWAAATDIAMTDDERAFVTTSLQLRELTTKAELARQAREVDLERRSVRRLRVTVAVLAVAALVAGALTLLAIDRSREAADQRDEATDLAAASQRQGLIAAADAAVDNDPEIALLLALEAGSLHEADDVPIGSDLTDVLHAALAAHRLVATIEPASVARFTTGDRILAGAADGRLRLFAADTAVVWESRDGHDGPIAALDVADDGSVAATLGLDRRVRVWDVPSGLLLVTLPIDDITAMRLDPAGELLAVGTAEGELSSWNAASGEMLATRQETDPELVFDWLPDGDLLIETIATGERGLFRAERATLQVDPQPMATFFGEACGMDVDEGTGSIAIGRLDLPTLIVDLGDGSTDAAGASLEGCALDQYGPVDGLFTSGIVAQGGSDSGVRVADTDAGRTIMRLDGHTAAVATLSFSDDGSRLVSAGADGIGRLWDTKILRAAELGGDLLGQPIGRLAAYGHLAWSEDGRFVVGTNQGEATAAEPDAAFAVSARIPNVLGTPFLGFYLPGRPAVSAAEGLIAAGSGPGVSIVELATGDERLRLVPSARPVDGPPEPTASAFDEGADRVAAIGSNGDVTVWSLDTADELLSTATAAISPIEVFFTAGDSELTIVSLDGGIEVIDASSGSTRRSLRSPVNVVDAAASRGGELLATAGIDGSLQVWRPATGELVAAWSTGATSSTVSITADGAELFASTTDGLITRWETTTGRLLGTPARFDGRIAAAVSPEGDRIAVATQFGGVQLLSTDPVELIELARSQVTRDLSRDECLQYLPAASCLRADQAGGDSRTN